MSRTRISQKTINSSGAITGTKSHGDPRPIGVLRAEVLAQLVLRPWEQSPPVTAQLVTELVLGKPSIHDLTPFSPARFG